MFCLGLVLLCIRSIYALCSTINLSSSNLGHQSVLVHSGYSTCTLKSAIAAEADHRCINYISFCVCNFIFLVYVLAILRLELTAAHQHCEAYCCTCLFHLLIKIHISNMCIFISIWNFQVGSPNGSTHLPVNVDWAFCCASKLALCQGNGKPHYLI